MQIRRNGILGKLCLLSSFKKKEISLCELPERGLLGMLLVVFGSIAWAVVGIQWALKWMCFFMVARRPSDPFDMEGEPYKRWPEMYGHRVWPAIILVPGIVAAEWLQVANGAEFSKIRMGSLAVLSVCMALAIIIPLAIYCVMKITKFCEKQKTSEIWKLMKLWMLAKKQKICPTIEIVD